jgi:tRNA (cytidine32/uridine32-2'-O)-methyltransferase
VQIPVRIVLVQPSHPGNIGAAARAMKTMGLTDLALVAPRHFPSDEATARASGADDLLAAARVTDSLVDAVADCSFVIGATARLRNMRWPVVDPRGCAAAIASQPAGTRSAIVMGPEQSGLTNDDLGRCRMLVHIPTNPEFGSLNLAMAVQVLCYELRMTGGGSDGALEENRGAPPATAAELDGFHEHLERVLATSGFMHPTQQRALKLKLRRLFQRARLDQNEVNILRGMLTALDPGNLDPGSLDPENLDTASEESA